jgi:hypothetical protein
MKLESLISFFKHISNREDSHGTRHAFRFKAVLSKRTKGSLKGTHYEDDAETSTEPSAGVRRKRRKRLPQVNVQDAILNEGTIITPRSSQSPTLPNDEVQSGNGIATTSNVADKIPKRRKSERIKGILVTHP